MQNPKLQNQSLAKRAKALLKVSPFLSADQIAEKLGCSRFTAAYFVRKAGVGEVIPSSSLRLIDSKILKYVSKNPGCTTREVNKAFPSLPNQSVCKRLWKLKRYGLLRHPKRKAQSHCFWYAITTPDSQ